MGAQVPIDDFDAVFRRYASYVSTVIYRTLGRREGVEDLVQDVFIDAFRHIQQLEDPEALKRWLAVIAVRRVYRHLRSQKIRTFFGPSLQSEEAPDLIAPGASPEQRALLHQVFDALSDLPLKQRVVWSLRHIEGMTLQEVSDTCECSMSTTKRRLAKADERLKKVMEP